MDYDDDDDKPLGVFIGIRNALLIIVCWVAGGLVGMVALRWWLT